MRFLFHPSGLFECPGTRNGPFDIVIEERDPAIFKDDGDLVSILNYLQCGIAPARDSADLDAAYAAGINSLEDVLANRGRLRSLLELKNS